MLESTAGDLLAFGLTAVVPATVVGIALFMWAHRKARQAYQSGQTSRDAEVAMLSTQVQSATDSIDAITADLVEAREVICQLQEDRDNARHDVTRLAEKVTQIPALQGELSTQRQKSEDLREQLEGTRRAAKIYETELENERKQSAEKLKLLTDAKDELSNQFKALAGEILDQKSQKFTEQNQANIQHLLKPLREQLTNFDKRVVDARAADAKEREQVRLDLQRIHELGAELNTNATELTRALKSDVKAQGTWGELILESILEKSGLEKGREYEVQESVKTEDGKRIRPDVLLKLPENKVIVVDSKVSLTAFERAANATSDEERIVAVTDHANSLKAHITNLGKKNYEQLIAHRTLDFVLIFVSNESALTLALNEAPELFDLAMERNIGLVSPNLLLITLRTIENLWRTEKQNQNALEIAKQAGALYDKFVGFVDSIEDVGNRLDQAKNAYDTAHKRLTSGTGNLVTRSEKLKRLGANTNKTLPASLISAASENPTELESPATDPESIAD